MTPLHSNKINQHWIVNLFVISLTIFFAFSDIYAADIDALTKLKLEGYESVGKVQLYNHKTIFRYMNGEAEAYFPHGFRSLQVKTYLNLKTHAQIIIEKFEMDSENGARGVFNTFVRDEGAFVSGIGEIAWKSEWSLTFKQRHYFFRISPDYNANTQETASLKEVTTIGKMLYSTIPPH